MLWTTITGKWIKLFKKWNKKKPCCARREAVLQPCPILQLLWNYNYKAAGDAIGFDNINHLEIVAANQPRCCSRWRCGFG